MAQTLVVFASLLATVLSQQTPIPAHYPSRVPGTCQAGQFDCGNGNCIDFTAVRDCTQDCADGSDELCGVQNGQQLVLCDANLPGDPGCGVCFNPTTDNAQQACRDRRWINLCSEPNVWQCSNTPNCVFNEWILDGGNDCADWSDENPCVAGRQNTCDANAACAFAAATQVTTCTCNAGYEGTGQTCTLAATTPASVTVGPCTGQFRCVDGSACIADTRVLDGINDCTDGSDENSCTLVPALAACAAPPSLLQCAYDPFSHTYGCGCPVGTVPNNRYCRAANPCPNQFRCVDGSRCVADVNILDGSTHCLDGSDENSCVIVPTLASCPAQPSAQQCSYSATSHTFACGCPTGFLPDSNRYCRALTNCPGEFRCNDNSACVADSRIMDGTNDCTDGSDENSCTTVAALAACAAPPSAQQCAYSSTTHTFGCGCPAGLEPDTNRICRTIIACTSQFRCLDNSRCVADSQVLDGINHCTDGSDENSCTLVAALAACAAAPSLQQCAYNPFSHTYGCGCPAGTVPNNRYCRAANPCPSQFRCVDGSRCVADVNVLDGSTHCLDGSDENSCTAVAALAACPVPPSVRQCAYSSTTHSFACGCPAGTAPNSNRVCAAISCTGQFACVNGAGCVIDSRVMDGTNDCTDGSDENSCTAVAALAACPAPPSAQQCAYSSTTHSFACGCPAGTAPNSNRVCAAISCTGQFACVNGAGCVTDNKVMDGTNDCTDGSDENSCTTVAVLAACAAPPSAQQCAYSATTHTFACGCPAGMLPDSSRVCRTITTCTEQFRCLDNSGCVIDGKMLDGVNDCTDGSDENSCTAVPSLAACPAPPSTRQCSYSPTTHTFGCGCPTGMAPDTKRICRTVISCLGQFTCLDNSACIADNKVLDGVKDCIDGSDEDSCSLVTSLAACLAPPSTLQCAYDPFVHNFNCGCRTDGTAPNNQRYCKAQNPCTNGFTCVDSSRCVTDSNVLNSVTHCLDASDEDSCTTVAALANCPVPPSAQQCAYNPTAHTFNCGCPTGMEPDVLRYCRAVTSCPGEFACRDGSGCVVDSKVLDGRNDCTDGSDENSCTAVPVLAACPAPPSNDQCAYRPLTHTFGCGCAELTEPDYKRYCRPMNDLPHDCGEILKTNVDRETGIETVFGHCLVPQYCTYEVTCDQQNLGGGWVVIQRKVNRTEDFARTWAEYKSGFGNQRAGDFWVGNEKLYDLTTNKDYELMLLMVAVIANKDTILRYRFNNFRLENEADKYRLRLGAMTEGIIDDFIWRRNQQFSTKDSGPLPHCAKMKDSGWWWDLGCLSIGTLNQPLENRQNDPSLNGQHWAGAPLKWVAMLMREQGFIVPPSKLKGTTNRAGILPVIVVIVFSFIKFY